MSNELYVKVIFIWILIKCLVRLIEGISYFISPLKMERLQIASHRRNITSSQVMINDLKQGKGLITVRSLALVEVVFFAACIKVFIGLW
ncbi:hypothetical protein ODQ17_17025 [Acinetobacter sp. IRS14]|uniref:hypothetical protein n=1 Tax=Acinetobacter sp. IRS14 TaxID=2983398 RepID=UPI002AFECCFC|nr:hypothetical protein [Acinetobacter sp. IRS14]MEA1231079.1 hypothetical protein [Acinetobacter sp. IRS14]